MRTLVLLALVGLGAQLVDGSLGMAYGVTSTTLLLAIGTNPATASATIHLAEIGTTLASGAAHWRFGNVDWKVVLRIGVPGAVGAFAGATFLANLSTEVAAPVMSLLLLALGVYVLSRFTFAGLPTGRLGLPLRKRFLAPLGLVAGFVDATGGGGWGPWARPRCSRRAGSSRARSSGPSTRASSSSRSRRRSGSSGRSARRGSTSRGSRRSCSAGSSPRRSRPGSCGCSHPGSSARPWAASSCSPTSARCCARVGRRERCGPGRRAGARRGRLGRGRRLVGASAPPRRRGGGCGRPGTRRRPHPAPATR